MVKKVNKNKRVCVPCQKCGRIRSLKEKPKAALCRSCASKIMEFNRTKHLNPNWKGGRIKDHKGYILIWVYPDDFFYPMASKGANGHYAFEHRLVMAKHLGRCLLPWEVVHHKGTKYPLGSIENKSDNRIENLELLSSQKAHLSSVSIAREFAKRDKRIVILENRVTLLEAENLLLRDSPLVRGA